MALGWCAASGCSQLLGADDIDWSLGPGGSAGMAAAGANAAGTGGAAGSEGRPAGGSGGQAGGSGGRAGAGGEPDTAGEAGKPGPIGDAGAPNIGSCAGVRGPLPVNIDGKFCIDSTEVTNRDYRDFVDARPAIEQPAECAWNRDPGDFEPASDVPWPPPEGILEHPVNGVDWCDALAYCEWAGKRLCGSVDRRPAVFNDYNTLNSELYYACSGAGQRSYPYGDSFDASACAIDRAAPRAVKSFPRCVGGFAGVYDLVGNVAEWQEPCVVAGDGAEDDCRLGALGVWFGEASREMWSCGAEHRSFRSATHSGFGIRCCSDVL